MQLDAFTDEGKITQQPPPDLAFEDELEPIEMMQDDLEDRLMGETSWMDEEAYMMSDMTSDPPTNTAQPPSPVPGEPATKHGAAMELAPSKQPLEQITDEPPERNDEEAPETEAVQENSAAESEPDENVRVRILETMPEPIMDASGDPLSLEAGDVHFLDEGTASWLIDAGVAERAEL